VTQVLNTSSRECEKKLLALSPEPVLPQEKERQLTPTDKLIQFVADQELDEYLESIKNLMSHKNPERRYDLLFKEMAKIVLNKLDPTREKRKPKPKKMTLARPTYPSSDHSQLEKHKGPETRSTPDNATALKTPAPEFQNLSQTRYIAAALRRKVWRTCDSSCSFVDPHTKTRCSSKHLLQVEHIIPLAKGGQTSINNLTLLCSAHNRFAGIKHFGREKMRFSDGFLNDIS
jgi:5-methylcytosine-specific restriction endonuclease McrA